LNDFRNAKTKSAASQSLDDKLLSRCSRRVTRRLFANVESINGESSQLEAWHAIVCNMRTVTLLTQKPSPPSRLLVLCSNVAMNMMSPAFRVQSLTSGNKYTDQRSSVLTCTFNCMSGGFRIDSGQQVSLHLPSVAISTFGFRRLHYIAPLGLHHITVSANFVVNISCGMLLMNPLALTHYSPPLPVHCFTLSLAYHLAPIIYIELLDFSHLSSPHSVSATM
jgi:hypothetical protein